MASRKTAKEDLLEVEPDSFSDESDEDISLKEAIDNALSGDVNAEEQENNASGDEITQSNVKNVPVRSSTRAKTHEKKPHASVLESEDKEVATKFSTGQKGNKDILETEDKDASTKSPKKQNSKKNISEADEEEINTKSPTRQRGKEIISESKDEEDVSTKSPKKQKGAKDVSESMGDEDVSLKTKKFLVNLPESEKVKKMLSRLRMKSSLQKNQQLIEGKGTKNPPPESKDDEDVSVKSLTRQSGKKDVSEMKNNEDVSTKSPTKQKVKKDVSESKDNEDVSTKSPTKKNVKDFSELEDKEVSGKSSRKRKGKRDVLQSQDEVVSAKKSNARKSTVNRGQTQSQKRKTTDNNSELDADTDSKEIEKSDAGKSKIMRTSERVKANAKSEKKNLDVIEQITVRSDETPNTVSVNKSENHSSVKRTNNSVSKKDGAAQKKSKQNPRVKSEEQSVSEKGESRPKRSKFYSNSTDSDARECDSESSQEGISPEEESEVEMSPSRPKQETLVLKNQKKEYACFVCSEVFHETKDLFEHTCRGKKSKGFMCKFCEKIYDLRSTYINHLRVHRRVKPFRCAECGDRYASQSERIAHMKRAHPEMEPYPCPIRNCEYSFSSNKELVFHSRMVHNANRCRYCDEKFDTSVKLQRHRYKMHERYF